MKRLTKGRLMSEVRLSQMTHLELAATRSPAIGNAKQRTIH